jgi:HSP90 family molecular chaperone
MNPSDTTPATPATSEAVERFEMRANFDGLVRLLARHLYPEPDVFVRELIQNAHDGIVRRHRVDSRADGRIDVDIDREARTVSIRDNGLGMDRQDIREFLSVIGSTGTGTTRRHLAVTDPATARALIGQFGIGALAAFVVADRVSVQTRRIDEQSGWQWENAGTSECTLRAHARELPGTTVTVQIAPDYHYMLDDAWVRAAIVRYCDFVAVPIHVGGTGPVNAVDAPWHGPEWADPAARESASRAFVARRFRGDPIAAIPVAIDSPVHVRGVLFIPDVHVPSGAASGVDVYIRRVFVRARDPDLLPPWARFVSGIIDTPDLTPTAARDNVCRTDAACRTLVEVLGKVVMRTLERLAREDPERFRRICATHHDQICGMAAAHDEFFDEIRDLLMFRTNRGLRTLADCIDPVAHPARPALHYFPADADAQQYYALADARDMIVVSAENAFEEDLLIRYVQSRGRDVRLVRLDTARDTLFFREPDKPLHRSCRRFERNAGDLLRRAGLPGITVAMRGFDPAETPAIALIGADSTAEIRLARTLSQAWFTESLQALTREVLECGAPPSLRFVLNLEHSLIRQLLEEGSLTPGLDDILCALFLAACLRAPDILGEGIADVLQPPLVRLLMRSVPDANTASPGALGPVRSHAAG